VLKIHVYLYLIISELLKLRIKNYPFSVYYMYHMYHMLPTSGLENVYLRVITICTEIQHRSSLNKCTI